MLWVKAFHIIAMVAWFAGLFYLPRLFVYHTSLGATEKLSYKRFCTMERRLYWGIMTPSALLTLFLGLGLVHLFHFSLSHPPFWLCCKLALVTLLIIYHVFCGICVKRFQLGNNRHSTGFYRGFNEISTVILIGIVLLTVIKPTI